MPKTTLLNNHVDNTHSGATLSYGSGRTKVIGAKGLMPLSSLDHEKRVRLADDFSAMDCWRLRIYGTLLKWMWHTLPWNMSGHQEAITQLVDTYHLINQALINHDKSHTHATAKP